MKENARQRQRTLSNSVDFDVIVIGAGPYGLSASAHLRASGISTQVFGEPMEFWDKKMPTGMLLRSPREASNISDPQARLTLEAYESLTGVEFVEQTPRQTFVNYGRWFESQLGSGVDRRNVSSLSRNGSGFKVVLSDGTTLTPSAPRKRTGSTSGSSRGTRGTTTASPIARILSASGRRRCQPRTSIPPPLSSTASSTTASTSAKDSSSSTPSSYSRFPARCSTSPTKATGSSNPKTPASGGKRSMIG